MKEPVDIMGVIAFPNENGKRDCRFIDPHYRHASSSLRLE